MLHIGTESDFKVVKTSPNGARTSPLKLKPNKASTTKPYVLLTVSGEGSSVMNGMFIDVHCVTSP